MILFGVCLILLEILVNAQSENISFVFSSLPMRTIDFTDKNGIGTNFKIAWQANLIFVSLGERGCMVLDGYNYTQIYEYKSDQFLSAIGVTSDARYVFLSKNNSIAMFEFANRNEFVFKSSASFNNCVILDIIVSSSNNFAFIAGEKGILAVYNIANPSNIFKVTELQTAATLINRINFSKDEKFLFIGNNELGFTLIKLNYNQLNNLESTVKLVLVGSALPYWKIFQCIPTQDLKYVYCTDYWYGVYISTLDDVISQPESKYPIQFNFKLRSWPLNSINPLVFSVELFNQDQYLLVSVRSLGIFIFDIKDRENLVLYQKIYVSGQPVQLSISPIDGNIIYANKIQLNIYKQIVPNLNIRNPNLFNSHQSMIVQYYPQVFYNWRCYLSRDNQYYYGTQDFMGLVIAYIPDKNPYSIQFKYLIPAIPPNFTEDTTVTKNRKYIFQAVQENGCTLKIHDISDLNNVQIIQCLTIDEPTQHAEQQAISDDETILVISYDNGILIIDVSIPTQAKILSYWKMEGIMIGNLAGVMITKDKKWVLVSTMDEGQLTLVNSSDPKNLYVISMFQQGEESSQSSCFTSDFQYAFINNELGTRIMPLKSQIILHTQISQFIVNQNNLVSSQVSLSQADILQVGQNIQFDFIPIYQKEGMVISKILYYDQSALQIQDLPSWIDVFNNNYSITFQVPKESLRSNVSEPVQNTILIKSALQLNASNFIYNQDGFQTNLTLAYQIFQIVRDKLLFLDENGFVTDRFLYNSNITLTDLQLQDLSLLEFIQKQVKITLQFAVFYNPVTFLTQNSLLFNQANKKQMITTPSQNLKITISFINNQGYNCVFVNLPYSGCIQELSSDQSTIQLSGSTININDVLFNQVIYHCKQYENNTNSNISIGVQIVDNLNYDYGGQFNITDSLFLKQLKNISINTQMHSLQYQFENQYQNSEIPIETDINFSFDNNYFIQPQSNFLPITYSLYYYDSSNDNYTLANSNYWIKLESSQLKFYAFASSDMFLTVTKLKIVASNVPSTTNLKIYENGQQVDDNNGHKPQYNKNQIQEAEEDDIFKNPLPILKIREKLICQILYQNGFIQDSKKGIDQLIEKDINPFLLKNTLLSDAMGLESLKMKSLLPSLGESIHCFPHQVKIIQASYLIPSQNYCFQRKNYKNYQPFSLETKLPKWLNVKCIKNAIVFYGTPKLSDEKVILVKIINQSNIIIRKFRICLLEELNNSFTKLDKIRKKTLVQPVYANYFHEIQKSLKEIDAEYEEKSQNDISEKSSEANDQQAQNVPNKIESQNIQRNFYSEQKMQNDIDENDIKFKQLAQSFFLPTDPDQKVEQQSIEKENNLKLPTKQFLEFIQTEILQASQAIDPIHNFQPKVLELNNSGSMHDSSKLAFQKYSQTNQQNINFTDNIPSEKQLPSFNF
ncbi:hypothetical protein ABPG73_002399 [Tetrahymena malaccensis]